MYPLLKGLLVLTERSKKKKKCSINMDSKSNPFDLKSNFYYILAFDIISESPYDRSI